MFNDVSALVTDENLGNSPEDFFGCTLKEDSDIVVSGLWVPLFGVHVANYHVELDCGREGDLCGRVVIVFQDRVHLSYLI